MIINATYGDAEGIGRYIQGPAKEHGRNVPGTEDRARIIESEGFGFPIHTQDDVDLARDVMRRDLELQHSNTKPITNTGIHSSMSWPEGYQPTRDEMRQAVDGLAKAWDMEGARRISWSHDDTKHRHLHTLWGPVNPDTGRAYHDHERNDRAQREAIRQEREHGPLPPSRQLDHDKAAAAEASDHARTYELSKNTDGSISRRSLDRALSLGGHFGPDKTAQRKEFIERNSLTKFPRQHFDPAYAPPDVVSEKRDYIRDNREASSNLTRAYNREAGERAYGVFRLYEDHSFEKTSKPPVQEERKGSMGINDILDWPWKKAREAIKKQWQERFPDRNFEKKLKEKGGDMSNPEVQQEWFKRYGKGDRQAEVSRERPRKDSGGRTSPEDVIREMKIDEGRKGAATEHARLKNWEIQRERRAKEERRAIPRDNTPPWRKDEERSFMWRREKQLQQEERDSKPLQESSLAKWYREQMAKPRPDHYVPLPGTDLQRQQQTPALSRPQEIPMPKIESHDHAPQTREETFYNPFSFVKRLGEIAKEKLEQEGNKERSQAPQQEPVRDRNKDTRTPQQIEQDEHGMAGTKIPDNSQEIENRQQQRAEDFRNEEPQQTAAEREENWRRDLDKINEELGKEQAERPEQGQELPRSPGPEETREDWIPPRLRKLHNQNDIAREEMRQNNIREGIRADGTAGQGWSMDRDDVSKRNKDIDAYSDLMVPRPQGYQPPSADRQESRADGTASQGRLDQTQAGQPGMLPGGSHEHGSPTRQFRDQLNESLKKIKIPEREMGKEQERER